MKHVYCLFIAFFCLFLVSTVSAQSLNVGDPFPDFTVANTLSKAQSDYLKVPPDSPIQLSAIPYDVIVVEFLNVYCHTCRLQVGIFNELKQAIAADPDLRGRVCLLGLAVGNSVEEIETFKEEFGPQYPILSDQDKVLFNSTGNTRGTPHTYLVRREEKDFIVDYHAGGVASPERYLESIRHILRSSLTGTQPGYKLPSLMFKVAGQTITNESLSGERFILYFASSRERTVKQDLRNMPAQIEVLKNIALDDQFKIFVFPPPQTAAASTAVPEPLYCARDKDNSVRTLLAVDDQPVVLCVNTYGRIVYRGESMTSSAAAQLIEGVEYQAKPKLSAQEIQDLIRKNLMAAGYQVAEIEHLTLENRQELYVITVAPQGSGVFFFARVESGITMCDVCHDTHFVYMFDQAGIVTDFFPLEITKYGNIPWTDEDIDKMKQNLVGRSIFESFEFNPKVDAVTTATMSSSIVYEAMNNAQEYFKDFYDYSFRAAYWQNVCFSVICKVKKLIEANREKPGFILDDSTLQKIITENALRGCPTGGMYIVLDGDVLCSQHGLNLQGCKQ